MYYRKMLSHPIHFHSLCPSCMIYRNKYNWKDRNEQVYIFQTIYTACHASRDRLHVSLSNDSIWLPFVCRTIWYNLINFTSTKCTYDIVACKIHFKFLITTPGIDSISLKPIRYLPSHDSVSSCRGLYRHSLTSSLPDLALWFVRVLALRYHI